VLGALVIVPVLFAASALGFALALLIGQEIVAPRGDAPRAGRVRGDADHHRLQALRPSLISRGRAV
jgi:hypothetical protein